jgi:hypothetical protein
LANDYANSGPPKNILTRCLVVAPCAACLIHRLVAKFSYILLVLTQRVPLVESNILVDKWVLYVLWESHCKQTIRTIMERLGDTFLSFLGITYSHYWEKVHLYHVQGSCRKIEKQKPNESKRLRTKKTTKTY